MTKEELASQAISHVKSAVTETKFIILRQNMDEDKEFSERVAKFYNMVKSNSPSIEWKLDNNSDLIAIIKYTKLSSYQITKIQGDSKDEVEEST